MTDDRTIQRTTQREWAYNDLTDALGDLVQVLQRDVARIIDFRSAVRSEGPEALGGTCIGTNVANEVMRLLNTSDRIAMMQAAMDAGNRLGNVPTAHPVVDVDDEEGAEVIEQEHADGHEGGFPVR